MMKSRYIEIAAVLLLSFSLIYLIRPVSVATFFPEGRMIKCDDYVFYNAYVPDVGIELFRYDTKSKSVKRYDLNSGADSSSPSNFTKIGNDIYFTAKTGKAFDILKTKNCEKVINVNKERSFTTSHPNFLTPIDNKLFFVDKHPDLGYEVLYLTLDDNSALGILDVWPGAGFSHPYLLTGVGNDLIFNADSGNGPELFRYNLKQQQAQVLVSQDDTLKSCIVRSFELKDGIRHLCLFKSLSLNNNEQIDIIDFNIGTTSHQTKNIYYLSHFNSHIVFPSNTDIEKKMLNIVDLIILPNRLLQQTFYVNYIDVTGLTGSPNIDGSVFNFTNIHFKDMTIDDSESGKPGSGKKSGKVARRVKTKEELKFFEDLRKTNELRQSEVVLDGTRFSRNSKKNLSPEVHEVLPEPKNDGTK